MPMTSTAPRTRKISQGRDDRQPDLVVRAGSPAALLTLVPHLLGFVPEATWS